MDAFSDIEETRAAVLAAKAKGRRTGLVPTMGALHAGHLALVEEARSRADFVVVTIFVNPTQFGPGEDFDAYPRPMEDDLAKCKAAGVDTVFAPTVGAMYGEDAVTTVSVTDLTERLCGAHRPGHFDGVTTIVAKLFHIAPCDIAVFGEKDYQQLTVIRRMVRDLDFPIEIVGTPTVREEDGLAMSSRNAYLSATEREHALSLSRALWGAQASVRGGERDAATLIAAMRETITGAGPCEIDYVEIVDGDSLEPVERVGANVRALVAVRIGGARLIDNIPLDDAATAG